MLKQLQLGKQGFLTSEQGIGMMSIGITVKKRTFMVKEMMLSLKVYPNLSTGASKLGLSILIARRHAKTFGLCL